MGRPLRYRQVNTTYHLYSSCHRRADLMKDDNIKELMLQVLRECLERYNFELIAFEILDNHFHFIIKTLENALHNISVIMKWIKSTFTRRYNKLKRLSGTFWNGRFGAKVIDLAKDAKAYLNTLLWYLAYNPVRKKMVKDPRDSKFGSINHYLMDGEDKKINSDSPLAHKITLHEHFLNLANDIKERVKKFLTYEESFKKRHSAYTRSNKAHKSPFLSHLHRIFVSRKKEKELDEKIRKELKKEGK